MAFCPICKKKMYLQEEVTKSGEVIEFWKCRECEREYDTKGVQPWLSKRK